MTWGRIEALYTEWQDRPPVHESFAAFIGIEPKTKKHGDLSELLGLFPSGNISVGGMGHNAPLPPRPPG